MTLSSERERLERCRYGYRVLGSSSKEEKCSEREGQRVSKKRDRSACPTALSLKPRHKHDVHTPSPHEPFFIESRCHNHLGAPRARVNERHPGLLPPMPETQSPRRQGADTTPNRHWWQVGVTSTDPRREYGPLCSPPWFKLVENHPQREEIQGLTAGWQFLRN